MGGCGDGMSAHCRSWQYDASTGSYVILSTSVSDPNATLLGGIRCTELAVRYLIEPAPANTTQLTMYCRVDLRYYTHTHDAII